MPKDNTYQCLIVESIREIPRGEWDGLFGPIIESYGYHKTLEESRIREFAMRYLLIRNKNTTVGIIPFFTVDFSFATIIQGKLQKVILSLQNKFKRFLKMRMLFVGAPTAEKLYLGLSKKEPADSLIKAALEGISDFAGRQGIGSVLFYNLTSEDAELAAILRRRGFSKIENFPNTLITIQAKSAEEHLDRLSKNTRKDLRRKKKKIEELRGVKIEVRENISGVKEEIFRLYMNNFDDSQIHFETLTPEFFEKICSNMPGEAKVFLCWQNDKLISFNLCLIKDDHCIDKFIGFDRELARKHHLYLASFLYNLSWCIEHGIKYYQLGITDYHPKIRLGAKLLAQHNYLRLSNPLFNFFCRFIAPLTSPVNFDPTLKSLRKNNA